MSSERIRTVSVPVADLEEVRDLLMELRHGSPARSPAHNARLAVEAMLMTAPVVEGGAELALGSPVKVEFSEAEIGRQTLYVAGVVHDNPEMLAPEYWLSETWPVNCRGDVSTGWKRNMFSPLATREEAPAEAGEDAELLAALRSMPRCHCAGDDWPSLYDRAADRLEALRAQPQAREEAQPVWVDGRKDVIRAYVEKNTRRGRNGWYITDLDRFMTFFPSFTTPPAPEAETKEQLAKRLIGEVLSEEKLRTDIVEAIYCPDISWGSANAAADRVLAALQQEDQ